MKTMKLKSFGVYKAIMNFSMYASIVLLVLLIASTFTPLNTINKFINMGFVFGKTTLSTSSNNGGEILVQLSRVNSNEYSSIKAKEDSIVLHSGKGESYNAYYSLSKLNIYVPEKLAEKIKWVICLIYLCVYLLTIFIIYTIRKVLYSLKNGSPFIMQNAESVNKIAVALFSVPFLSYILQSFMEYFIASTFNVWFNKSLGLSETDLFCVFGGLIMAILAYVLKQGVLMKEEQDLTI